MDGEMARDYALAASGLLVPGIGGPSVKPYQPDGICEAVAMPVSNTRFYQRDSGEKLYHRSLYTFWKRSAPPASLGLPNGRWGEINFAATPCCAVASRLPEEQPARKAKVIVAASVAANIDIARPDPLFTIEE